MAGRTTGRACRRCGTRRIASARWLGSIGKPAEYVSCFGCGTIRKELVKHYDSPFAVESAHIKFAKTRRQRAHHPLALRHRAAVSREHRRLWQQSVGRMAARRARAARSCTRRSCPSRRFPSRSRRRISRSGCPKPIQPFTTKGVYDLGQEDAPQLHAGRRPRRQSIRTSRTRFVIALVEDRDPFPNARQSANWTCVGLCAHESALKGGAIVKLPAWSI